MNENETVQQNEARAWNITKGTHQEIVFDNRHGRRAVASLLTRQRKARRPRKR